VCADILVAFYKEKSGLKTCSSDDSRGFELTYQYSLTIADYNIYRSDIKTGKSQQKQKQNPNPGIEHIMYLNEDF